MNDLLFDIVTREVVIKANDFETTVNPSVQNGGILLYSRCSNLSAPMVGIGILEIINGPLSRMVFEMNRWQQQLVNDGGRGKWSSKPIAGAQEIDTQVNYL